MPADGPREILRTVFGYDAFRTGQAEAIDGLLAGRNVLAVMPTGAGKSLCFQVPALVRGGLTVVVSPLVALMQNQVAALRLSGVAAAAINSAAPRSQNVAIWQQVRAGALRLLYLSPERLMTPRMLEALAALKPDFFAIDEAHCISHWGPAFRPEYEQLTALRQHFPHSPIMALTATADPVTREDIVARLFGGQAEVIVTGFDRPNLRLAVEMKQNWKRQVSEFVAARRGQAGIVYCLSRRKTEEVARLLSEAGHVALAYHAGMGAAERAANQDRFMTEPGVVMVATIAFGMGIDKPDIRYVLHTDLPGGPEAYYQEIGRAGRDGAPAEAHMLYGLDDIRMRRSFIESENADEERKRRQHQRLGALLAFCEAPACRRQTLLAYFGETIAPCGACDNCQTPVATVDGREAGQLALSAIQHTGERFGAGHIVDIITGAQTRKIAERGHDRLEAFAAGVARPAGEWRGILRQLVATGFLEIDIGGFGALVITPRGRALMRGEEDFRYRPDAGRKAAGRTRKKTVSASALSREDEALLLDLKQLRLRLAVERGVPAYVIFSDRTLIDMAARRPADAAGFARVFGVGEAKQRDFAALFLAAIAEHEASGAAALRAGG